MNNEDDPLRMYPKYRVPVFLDFYARYKFPDVKAKHTADVALSYYIYAYHQYCSYVEAYDAFFKKENPDNNEEMFYLRQSWSYALGMYALSRTCFEALHVLRQMLGDNEPVDEYYQKNIKRFIDVANDIVKHPTFRHGEASEACEPKGLSMTGEIEVANWSDSGELTTIDLNPRDDFMLVHYYLEHFAEKLLGKMQNKS